MSTVPRQIVLDLSKSETYVCFKNSEGIFVFNRMKSGEMTVTVNENDIATDISGNSSLELSGFSFGEISPQIDLVRDMKAKIEGLNENEFQTINNILA